MLKILEIQIRLHELMNVNFFDDCSSIRHTLCKLRTMENMSLQCICRKKPYVSQWRIPTPREQLLIRYNFLKIGLKTICFQTQELAYILQRDGKLPHPATKVWVLWLQRETGIHIVFCYFLLG